MLPNIRGSDDADGVPPPRLRQHAHLAPLSRHGVEGEDGVVVKVVPHQIVST